MGMDFTFQESSALYGLLAETGSDIILKLDTGGCIVHASPGIARLGVCLLPAANGPHLLDFVADAGRAAVGAALDAALAGRAGGGWVEFAARPAAAGTASHDERESWFELRARPLREDGAGATGRVYGAIAVMRSIEERRVLKDQLFAATYTDPLTRLTNRAAFISTLDHMIDAGVGGCVAMFSIDFFRTINMQFGQSTGDEVLRVFAELLRELLREDDLISRIGSERFAVLLPRTAPDQAEALCRRVVTTLADLRRTVGESRMAITASASVARIGESLDDTMERAELALFCARAKGRNRLEMEKPRRVLAA